MNRPINFLTLNHVRMYKYTAPFGQNLDVQFHASCRECHSSRWTVVMQKYPHFQEADTQSKVTWFSTRTTSVCNIRRWTMSKHRSNNLLFRLNLWSLEKDITKKYHKMNNIIYIIFEFMILKNFRDQRLILNRYSFRLRLTRKCFWRTK